MPFDNLFSIITECPVDDPGGMELQFQVPTSYYAELIQLSLTITGPAIGGLNQNYLILEITRGSEILYLTVSTTQMSGGSLTVIASFALSVTPSGPNAKRLFWSVPLQGKIYLYPEDLISVSIKPQGDVFTLTGLTVVMKQWLL